MCCIPVCMNPEEIAGTVFINCNNVFSYLYCELCWFLYSDLSSITVGIVRFAMELLLPIVVFPECKQFPNLQVKNLEGCKQTPSQSISDIS